MTYELIPLETLSPPPVSGASLEEVIFWLALLHQAVNELNSKISYVAAEATITIPDSGG